MEEEEKEEEEEDESGRSHFREVGGGDNEAEHGGSLALPHPDQTGRGGGRERQPLAPPPRPASRRPRRSLQVTAGLGPPGSGTQT